MPITVEISLRIANIDAVLLQGIHAHVCRWLDTSETHRATAKPFSVTPLLAEEGERHRFHINLLDDMLIDRLQRSIEAESGYVIKFGATPAQLDNPATRIVRHLPYSKIVEITQGRHISEWDVDVQSPLLIRQGDRELIFPLPGSVLRSLHRQWVCWSDVVEGFPREISELPMLRTIGFDGSSSTVEVRGRPRTGFLGAVRYGLDSSVCRQAQAQVDALMEFAQFSGVGAMTTYGLGVVAVTPRL